MSKEIRIKKTVFDKRDFISVVDRSFTSFVEPEQVIETDTVEELFRLYEKLYFSIPKEGETNSHRYILERSSELVDFEKNTEDIQPLLNEIAQLRVQLLNANQQIFELQSQIVENGTN